MTKVVITLYILSDQLQNKFCKLMTGSKKIIFYYNDFYRTITILEITI